MASPTFPPRNANVPYPEKKKEPDFKETLSEKAQDFKETDEEKAKSLTERAKAAASTVGEKVEEGVAAVGGGMKSLAETVREKGPHQGAFGSATSSVAESLESGGRYLQEQGLSGMADDMS